MANHTINKFIGMIKDFKVLVYGIPFYVTLIVMQCYKSYLCHVKDLKIARLKNDYKRLILELIKCFMFSKSIPSLI